MHKRLEDLTKTEWDTLFPVELVSHDPNWKLIYAVERQKITEFIGEKIIKIEHVGSTAIPAISAKPYIDISIEIPRENLFNKGIISAMERLNYHFFRQFGKAEDYMIFVKGYNLNASKAQIFHVHMCPSRHEMLNQVLFRDLLLANPSRAVEYGLLKIDLAKKFRNDRVGYRMAKGEFVAETLISF